jgi:thioesterase domain-containing protein
LLQRIQPHVEPRVYEQIKRLLPVRYAHERAVQRYLEKLHSCKEAYRYPGRIVLFRTKDKQEPGDAPVSTQDPELSLGWSSFSSQPVDVRWISGTHASCIAEPHVNGIAQEIMQYTGQHSRQVCV